ncbi:MAG: hypothetical protein ACHQK8_04330 [Bacteroidia bacterium]
MLLTIAFFSSCEKAEQPVTLPAANDSSRLETFTMGANYDKQIFVNVETNQSTVIENNSWDLYFDSDRNGYMAYMNGGKGVLIAKAGTTNFSNIPDPSSLKFQWDAASGVEDSTALDGWCDELLFLSYDSVFVIDRGASITDPSRYMQFQITYVDQLKYKLRIANIDGTNSHDFTVNKDPLKAHVYFSFDNGGTYLNPEPEKNEWHFCFLRYRWVYYQFTPPLLYSVTGIFINSNKVEVAVDSTMKFEDISFSKRHNLQFNRNRDAMGFDWKVYNFTTGKYTARKYVNYILHSDYPTKYYKLRFLDFYSNQGLKGTPSFEVQGM